MLTLGVRSKGFVIVRKVNDMRDITMERVVVDRKVKASLRPLKSRVFAVESNSRAAFNFFFDLAQPYTKS